MDTTPEILNAQGAANLLKVSEQTIRRMVYAGELPVLKYAGKQIRILKKDLFATEYRATESEGKS